MTLADFDLIKENLQTEFDEFWTPGVLKSELENINSKYIVAKENNEIIGFAGIIVTPIDVEITNIVTKKSKRKKPKRQGKKIKIKYKKKKLIIKKNRNKQ